VQVQAPEISLIIVNLFLNTLYKQRNYGFLHFLHVKVGHSCQTVHNTPACRFWPSTGPPFLLTLGNSNPLVICNTAHCQKDLGGFAKAKYFSKKKLSPGAITPLAILGQASPYNMLILYSIQYDLPLYQVSLKSLIKDRVLSAFKHHCARCNNLPFTGFILIPIGANLLRIYPMRKKFVNLNLESVGKIFCGGRFL
jgi:hypothetical protein